nr:MAG TPA: hypothetical protein [Bacteriophage sp.]
MYSIYISPNMSAIYLASLTIEYMSYIYYNIDSD